jgi:hypothetical protein
LLLFVVKRIQGGCRFLIWADVNKNIIEKIGWNDFEETGSNVVCISFVGGGYWEFVDSLRTSAFAWNGLSSAGGAHKFEVFLLELDSLRLHQLFSKGSLSLEVYWKNLTLDSLESPHIAKMRNWSGKVQQGLISFNTNLNMNFLDWQHL